MDGEQTGRAREFYVRIAERFDSGDLVAVQEVVTPDIEYLVLGPTRWAGIYRGPGAVMALFAKVKSIAHGRIGERRILHASDSVLLSHSMLRDGLEFFIAQEYDETGRLKRGAMMFVGDPESEASALRDAGLEIPGDR